MGWLSRLLSRRPVLEAGQLAKTLASIASKVANRDEYRAELVKAAEAGDLDAPYDAWEAANKRAREYIQNG